jgi:hypothetical protein
MPSRRFGALVDPTLTGSPPLLPDAEAVRWQGHDTYEHYAKYFTEQFWSGECTRVGSLV